MSITNLNFPREPARFSPAGSGHQSAGGGILYADTQPTITELRAAFGAC
jgi:hypothetical protein